MNLHYLSRAELEASPCPHAEAYLERNYEHFLCLGPSLPALPKEAARIDPNDWPFDPTRTAIRPITYHES